MPISSRSHACPRCLATLLELVRTPRCHLSGYNSLSQLLYPTVSSIKGLPIAPISSVLASPSSTMQFSKLLSSLLVVSALGMANAAPSVVNSTLNYASASPISDLRQGEPIKDIIVERAPVLGSSGITVSLWILCWTSSPLDDAGRGQYQCQRRPCRLCKHPRIQTVCWLNPSSTF